MLIVFRSYEKMEKEVTKILGFRWAALSDKEVKLKQLNFTSPQRRNFWNQKKKLFMFQSFKNDATFEITKKLFPFQSFKNDATFEITKKCYFRFNISHFNYDVTTTQHLKGEGSTARNSSARKKCSTPKSRLLDSVWADSVKIKTARKKISLAVLKKKKKKFFCFIFDLVRFGQVKLG
jgi:hypothetical protein